MLLLHFLGHTFNENYGLAIIVIVFILRLILMPLMCIQVKIFMLFVAKQMS